MDGVNINGNMEARGRKARFAVVVALVLALTVPQLFVGAEPASAADKGDPRFVMDKTHYWTEAYYEDVLWIHVTHISDGIVEYSSSDEDIAQVVVDDEEPGYAKVNVDNARFWDTSDVYHSVIITVTLPETERFSGAVGYVTIDFGFPAESPPWVMAHWSQGIDLCVGDAYDLGWPGISLKYQADALECANFYGKPFKQFVLFKSSNPSVVSVTTDGHVVARKAGVAVVTVDVPETIYDSAGGEKVVFRIAKEKSLTLSAGKTFSLDESAKTDHYMKLIYGSSDTSIATVSKDGKITAKKPGKAVITINEVSTLSSQSKVDTATKKATVYVTPKKVSIKVPTAGNRAFTAKWKASANATGYQIVYAKNSKFTKAKKTVTVKGAKTVSKTIKKLKKGTYYVKVHAYKTIGGKRYYGPSSNARTVKVK